MIVTVDQQRYAVEHFAQWLAHPNELGFTPAKIEIEKVFDFEEESFVIMKFKPKPEDEWLLGECGGFTLGKATDSGLTWSEFEPYDEETAVEKCKGYISKLKEREKGDPVLATQKLIEEGKWAKVVEYVDNNIEKYRLPREVDGKKVYQFYDVDDFIYYDFLNEEACEWQNGQELRLLSNKLYAQVELIDPKALETADEMLKIAPNYIPVLMERCEYFKRVKDYESCRKALDEMYNYIWDAKEFARYMRSRAWLSIEEKDIEAAVHYLSWSVLYDDSEGSFRFVEGELNYIKNQFGFENVPRPPYGKTFEYFMSRKLSVIPSKVNRNFCMRLYDYYLRNRETQNRRCEDAKANLLAITAALGSGRTDVKTVEINVLTSNWYEISFEHGCAFQVPKSLKNLKAQNGNMFEYESKDGGGLKIEVKPFAKFENEDMLANMLEGKLLAITNFNQNVELLDMVNEKGEKVKRCSYIDGDKMVEIYLFKFTDNLFGELTASYPVGSDYENEIATILNTWEKNYREN